MATPVLTETIDLAAKFPGLVTPDARPGYSGWMVAKEALVEVATAIRDEMGYDLLSNVTGVDYLDPTGQTLSKLEVVYHVYKTTGGPALTFKTQTERVDPAEVPSLVSVWPGAELQEREAWDMFGIKFTGHPDLRRILMWEGFEGFPMRKDFKEAFHEEDNKPLKNRSWGTCIATMRKSANEIPSCKTFLIRTGWITSTPCTTPGRMPWQLKN